MASVVLVVYFMYIISEPLADGRRHGDVVLLGLGRLLLLLGLGVPARVCLLPFPNSPGSERLNCPALLLRYAIVMIVRREAD